MELSNIIPFIISSILLTIAPGPDIIFVITQSISQGKKAGIATSLGLCSGLVVHTTAAALGISAILHQSAIAFNIVKYAGAGYILFLAYKALKEKDHGEIKKTNNYKEASFLNLYKKGIFMNILNPKVGLFFLAFLPQFVSASSENVTIQMIILGIIFIIQAIIVFSVVSVLAGAFGDKLIGNSKIGKKLNVGKAIIFGLLGLKIAFTK